MMKKEEAPRPAYGNLPRLYLARWLEDIYLLSLASSAVKGCADQSPGSIGGSHH